MEQKNFLYDPRIDLNDSEVISHLMEESPANFIKILTDQIKAYAYLIGGYAVLTGEDENTKDIRISGYSYKGDNASVEEVMNWINGHTKDIDKLMDIALTYAEKKLG